MLLLHNKKILITRPEHQTTTLIKHIMALGGVPIALPTIEIAPVDANSVLPVLTRLADFDIAIFISANAVTHTFALLQQHHIIWPNTLKIAAIGPATVAALAQHQKLADWYPPTEFTSEALLALPMLAQLHGKKIILLQGVGGRELLATTLRERGALVSEAAVYRRILPFYDSTATVASLRQLAVDIIVCTSNTSLQNLYTVVSPTGRQWLQNMSLLVASERMAELVQTLGFIHKPLIAANATDAAILEALLAWAETHSLIT